MKTFYDPHPGFAGAAIRLPEVVRLVANGMVDKEMEVEKAVSILQDAANTLVSDGDFGSAKVADHPNYQYIGLMLSDDEEGGDKYPSHSFCLIRYK